tara:strand:- start:15574 stop:16494 length:921 start_codon:yes stop_codon:yes gene_type:complete
MSFEQLKQNRDSAISKLVSAADTNNEKKSYGDDRLWKPTVDKAGNGYAVIRFLPAGGGEDLPWVRYWDHGFKGPTGRWYIEKSLTTLGQPDPVSELNSQLWNTGRDEDKETARNRKRRLHHVSNIMVISDSANPANEGKVFLYEYGKKLMDKIMDVMQPQFQDEKAVNPFDFWAGANFKLKIRNLEGYRNYDKSEFDSSSEFLDGDEGRLKEVYDKLYPLSEFTDPEQYKSYADLKRKMFEVIGEAEVATGLSTEQHVELNTTIDASPQPSMDSGDSTANSSNTSATSDEESSEDTLSYFAKLASS